MEIPKEWQGVSTPGGICWVVCGGPCDGNRRHCVLSSHELENIAPVMTSGSSHQVIRCEGCYALSFRFVMWTMGEDSRKVILIEKLYPSRRPGSIPTLNSASYFPSVVQDMYLELHFAMANEQRILAGVGIRILIEAICLDQKANGSNLKEKIDDLVKLNKLTPDGAEIMHKTRLLGNEAAHEAMPPDDNRLAAAMDVVEHLLAGLYTLPRRARALAKNETPDQ